MATIRCRVVTPTAQLLDEQVSYASIPAWDGLFGVLPGHAPLVARLGIGELRLSTAKEAGAQGGDRSVYINGGFVRVAENDVIVLADDAVPAERLTETDAKAELAEAEARQIPADAKDKAEAAEQIRLAKERARAKLAMASRVRARGI
jgi:F-type H+-transporting ATPase subunit epsilon